MNSDSCNKSNRRSFLLASLRGAGGTWVSLHWPAVVAAAQHAAHARQAVPPPKLEILSNEQAAEVEAVASRIIPTDQSPGAREAGVIYFIDRALATFAQDNRADYEEGIPLLQAKTREMFPNLERFSSALPDQQDEGPMRMLGSPRSA